MALLDWLFGPAAAAGRIYDPRAVRQAAISQALLGAGAGLLSGKNWQQGIGQGLLGAGQGAQLGRQSAMQSQLFNQQMAEAQREEDQRRRTEAVFAGGGVPAMAGGPQLAQAGGATTGAQQGDLLSSLQPDQQQRLKLIYETFGAEAAQTALTDMLKAQEPVTVSEGADLVGPDGKVIYSNDKPFAPNIQTLIEGQNEKQGYFDQSGQWVPLGQGPRWQPAQGPTTISPITLLMPDGSFKSFANTDIAGVNAALSQGAIEPQRSGLVVETNPDGTTTVSMGNPSASGLTRTTQNEVQAGLLSVGTKLQTVQQIANTYQPLYQNVGTKFDQWANAWRDKLGMPVDPSDKQALTEYTTFVASAAQNFAAVVKEMAGTAMTPAEAERQLAYLPNPGTGVFDGDSPTQFQAKLDQFQKNLVMAQARLAYINGNQSFNMMPSLDAALNAVPLESMPAIMNQRGEELKKKYQSQGMPAAQIDAAVTRQLALEFGLVSQ